MTRWTHTLKFNTNGLTLIEWYQSEMPKYILLHGNDIKYNDQVIEAKTILKTTNSFFPNGISRHQRLKEKI